MTPLATLIQQRHASPATPVQITSVRKRDGRIVPWETARIARALDLAFRAVTPDAMPSPSTITQITTAVTTIAGMTTPAGSPIDLERVQDLVEQQLAATGHFDVAKAYVLYRAEKTAARLRTHGDVGLSDYIVQAKYMQFDATKGRRELWPEATARVFAMHRRKFAHQLATPLPTLGYDSLGAFLDAMEAGVTDKRVLGSMRGQQFAGPAIEANNARMFNCAFAHIDSVAKIGEAAWLLLSGCGVGFSVQRHHVAKLPPLPRRAATDDLPVVHYAVADSIAGWADAIHALMGSYYDGTHVEFNYSAIRRKGSLLKTSGGRAPGHQPLKRALDQMRRVLDGAQGRALKPIEVYDLLMYVAAAVVAGGIRRSATICLFSPDDSEMTTAKTGNWFETNPQRGKSNNSAVLVRDTATRAEFDALAKAVKDYGEPGFYFSDSTEYGANPCVEIGLAPTAVVSEADVEALRARGFSGPLVAGDTVSGWQMCNLSTINGARCETPEAFYAAVELAAGIGSLQAAYTDMPYLGPVTRWLNEREALLGVSICGIMDRPTVLLDPAVLRHGAAVAKATNAAVAAVIGTQPAARLTCVKPEGTASLVLGCGSGIHPHHAKRYFRRVQAARTEPLYQWFKLHNPSWCEPSAWDPQTTDVITFPVEAPEGAIVNADITALTFLQAVALVQEHWVEAGTAHERYNPGLRHNVSNTVTVRPDEWEAVADYIWTHRASFTGIALIPASGDKDYLQAPREAVSTAQDVAKWNAMQYVPVDWALLAETDDHTALAASVACAGGACEII